MFAADMNNMDLSAIALQGLAQAEVQLSAAASTLASAGAASPERSQPRPRQSQRGNRGAQRRQDPCCRQPQCSENCGSDTAKYHQSLRLISTTRDRHFEPPWAARPYSPMPSETPACFAPRRRRGT